MKVFLTAVIENTQPLSKKLLFASFIAGYILATLFFRFYRPQIHHSLAYFLQSI